MSADLHHLSGLHGANLSAFQCAQAIVETNMLRLDPEIVLRSMRAELALAVQAFPTDREKADAHVAIAANKLAVAIRIQEDAS